MDLQQGITPADRGLDGVQWNVVGQIYTPKLVSDNAFVWHAHVPAETFVPPHIHPKQDEWIFMLDGELEVEFADQKVTARPGDTVRMPMNQQHGIFNRSGKDANCVFGVAPSGKLFELFQALDKVTDPDELVRLSAEHDVDFLPPPD